MRTAAWPYDEIAHHMALLPFGAVVVRSMWGKVPLAWWWLSGVFLVSWLTDSLAHVVDPTILSFAYPVAQAAMVVGVLRSVEDGIATLFPLTLAGFLVVLVGWPLFLLRLAAYLVITLVAVQLPPSKLSVSLLVTFTGGLVVWGLYLLDPGWMSWGTYQGVRAAGIGFFCRAVWEYRDVV